MIEPLVAGVELGGTKAIAILARGTEIIDFFSDTTSEPQKTLGRLSLKVDEWFSSSTPPEAIGIGTFGPVCLDPNEEAFGFITNTPKEHWANVDVRGWFARRYSCPIAFNTDVAGAALAEWRWGAGQGCNVVAYITVGTGIGGALVVDGSPLSGAIHAEIGHVRVRRTLDLRFPGICPFHNDCIEGLASGPALAARTGRQGADIPSGDPVWEVISLELAELVATIMLTASPQAVLLGGGVIISRPHLVEQIARNVDRLLGGYIPFREGQPVRSAISLAGLRHMSGPLGAVALGLANREMQVRSSANIL